MGEAQSPTFSLVVSTFSDSRNGPAHDTALFRSFLKEHNVPQKLALLCLDAKEVSATIVSDNYQ